MNLGTKDRWTDTNTESPHRSSVPFHGIEPLFAVVNVDCTRTPRRGLAIPSAVSLWGRGPQCKR